MVSVQSTYTVEPITDLEELAVAMTEHHSLTQTLEQSIEIVENNFVFGYKILDSGATGFTYILKIAGLYLLDASNMGIKVFDAIKVTRKVNAEVFEAYTDCLFCLYDNDDIKNQIICKRLGFKKLTNIDSKEIFFLQKE